MSGLEVEVLGLAPVLAALRRMGSDEGQRSILEVIGSEVESQTRRRLESEKRTPDGDTWDDWSDNYAARRPAKGGKLDLEGNLIDSIQAGEPQSDYIEIGSNLVYAKRQNAQREYIGLSPSNEREIDDVLTDWLEGMVA